MTNSNLKSKAELERDETRKQKRDNYIFGSEEVFEYVSKENPEIGIATVYRTLQLFEELDVLYKISFDDGVARYEIKAKFCKTQFNY